MPRLRLVIQNLSTVSALGDCADVVRDTVAKSEPVVSRAHGHPIFALSADTESRIMQPLPPDLEAGDRVVRLAVAAAIRCISGFQQRGGAGACGRVGVSIGSARGATGSFEQLHQQFLTSPSASLPVDTSPRTTAGGLSAAVARSVRSQWESDTSLLSLDTSMTCTSAFHSLLTGVAFLRAGMIDSWIFGGAEAAITQFCIAQMLALRIYSPFADEWPCRPATRYTGQKRPVNTLVLGEGAGIGVLRVVNTEEADGVELNASDLIVLGIGWAVEEVASATGISKDGTAFETSMRHAISELELGQLVDAVVLHAPGTVKGDAAELAAVDRVFAGAAASGVMPRLYSTKHLSGHTYGASGMLSLELARCLLQESRRGRPFWGGVPYGSFLAEGEKALSGMPRSATERGTDSSLPASVPIRTVLINTAGFGGNALSVIVGYAG